ncbi:MAG TPA: DUF4340 domain-containing protein, partial [Myxococcota bacterium]|nr:DUF4340 domain-containing protein [Myxococcota bacterium]
MSPKTTAILFALAAALASFVYFYEIEGEQARLDAKAAEGRLFRDLEQGAIESIALRAADAPEIRFERRDAHWRIVSPLDAAADAFAVDGLAGAIAQLSSESVIEQPRALDVYGIDAQGTQVRFQGGGSEKVLRLGKTTPVGGNTYVAIDGDARVFTVVSYQLQPFRKKLDEFRDKQILSFDRAAVKTIRISSSEARLVLERGDDGWRVASPVDDRADADSVEQLLSSLAYLRASGFVDDAIDDAVTGLASPDLAIELETPAQEGDAEPTIARLAVGGVKEGGSERYARGSSGALYTISQSSLDDIERGVVDYRDLRLAELAVDEARRVELGFHTEGGETVAIRVERAEDGWRSDAEPIDSSRLDELVRALASLRATDVVAEQLGAEELAAMGLEP